MGFDVTTFANLQGINTLGLFLARVDSGFRKQSFAARVQSLWALTLRPANHLWIICTIWTYLNSSNSGSLGLAAKNRVAQVASLAAFTS